VSDYRIISDIVKEYPTMFKVVIYHNDYRLDISHERKERKQRNSLENINRSVRRTKSLIQDIMLSNRFDIWATFTFNCRNCQPKCNNKPCTCSKENCKRYDKDYCFRTMRTWLRNQRQKSPKLKYLIVSEQHKDGAYHFHAVLENYDGVLVPTRKKTPAGQTIYNARGYYSGFTEFVKIGERFDTQDFETDYQRVIFYISKYITKDMPQVFGKKRYLCSVGLDRPVTTVNGLHKKGLNFLVENHKPVYITDKFELQKIAKTAIAKIKPFEKQLEINLNTPSLNDVSSIWDH
jgi:hypothetical protein